MKPLRIVIPVYRETELDKLVEYLYDNAFDSSSFEIVFADFQDSSDLNHSAARKKNSPKKGRAAQMNFGAENFHGDILYFLHADSFPPEHFDLLIQESIKNGADAGCFKMRFDTNNVFLNAFSWFTQFNLNLCRGGDQSLFIKTQTFTEIEGFDEHMTIMEDLEIIGRIRKEHQFSVVTSAEIITSARKYRKNGIYKLQFLFGLLHLQRVFGRSPQKMSAFYQKYITG
ncbi:MAG: glycosyltransferase [Bacteroidota bacterium]